MPATNPGTTGLVSWWSLDETSGTRYDAHGSNDLTDNNTVGYATGKQSNAADFVAANSERLTSTSSDFDPGNTDFTITGWFYLDTTAASQRIVSSVGNEFFLQYNTSVYLRWVGYNSTWFSATWGSISASTWYHFAVWHDAAGDECGIVLDAGTAVTDSWNEGMAASTNFGVGARPDGVEPVDGRVDELSWWSRVLTSDEIAWLYNGGSGRTYSELSAGGVPLPLLMSGAVRVG